MSLESLGIDLRDMYPSELSMGYNHNLRLVLSVRIGDKDGDKPVQISFSINEFYVGSYGLYEFNGITT